MESGSLKKYVLAVIVLLLVASVVLNIVVLVKISKIGASSGPSATAIAGPASAGVSSGAKATGASTASTQPTQASAPKDMGSVTDDFIISNMVMTLKNGQSSSSAVAWLTQNNFSINASAGTPGTVAFGGLASQVKNLFGVQVHGYAAGATTCYSGATAGNASLPVPSKLSSSVSSVSLPGCGGGL